MQPSHMCMMGSSNREDQTAWENILHSDISALSLLHCSISFIFFFSPLLPLIMHLKSNQVSFTIISVIYSDITGRCATGIVQRFTHGQHKTQRRTNETTEDHVQCTCKQTEQQSSIGYETSLNV